MDFPLAELCADLRSPDPAVRDDHAYTALAALVPRLNPEQAVELGDAMAERFTDPEVQARTFAPLILAALVKHGHYRPSWLAAFAAWYPAEPDLRGYDAELGWLHAVAHGADLLGAFGTHGEADPELLLALGAARMVAPTAQVWDALEDDRLAHAMARVLLRPGLTDAQSTGWLDRVAELFAAGRPGPVPAEASNTIRTLWLLHLCAVRGVRPSRYGDEPVVPLTRADAVARRLVELLAIPSPYLG
ncbi:hypothetical protein C7C46_25590 [Streptomyces tateyamensis]|uniref:DUF2785 domain-containing protein n=1 Tax=Streptomyces tateyamensis TaxID=565073 RepID=A0A2V4MWD7_9ACTN|nr:DUF2785 domain-containing protein [Streptomyces tateyamensis]PYC72727.1 hypothetical protein C7C46_25590 [Streptomyces tateyamensis]